MAKKSKPLTAEVKAARASQYQATQLGIEQSMARTRTVSRGAYGSRSLRAGGTGLSLDQTYGIGGFKDDPGALQRVFGGGYTPQVPVYTPPRAPKAPPSKTSPKPSPKPKPKPKPKKPTPIPPPSNRPRPYPV